MGQNRKYENVMLLAMSTLPRNPEINTYQIQEEKETLYFKGISQMEQITSFRDYKEKQYDLLANIVRDHIDMDLLYRIIGISN